MSALNGGPVSAYGQVIPISTLPPLITPLAGSEPFPCVQAGVTRRAKITDLIPILQPFYLRTIVSLYYRAAQGQTVFNLGTEDQFQKFFVTLKTQNVVQVTRSGARLAMDDGSGYGGYVVNIPGNSVVLLTPAGANEQIVVDVWDTAAPGYPAPALSTALYYQAVAGQTAFDLSAEDLFGQSTTLVSVVGLQVYRNGGLLTPDPGGGVGDYTVNVNSNTITLTLPAGASEMVSVLIFVVPAAMPAPPTPLLVTEPVSVTGTNTFGLLQHTFDGVTSFLFVNGRVFAPPDFSIVGKLITWNNTTFSVTTSDTVVAFYSHQ